MENAVRHGAAATLTLADAPSGGAVVSLSLPYRDSTYEIWKDEKD